MAIVEDSAAAVTPQNASAGGTVLAPLAADATNGHKFQNDGRKRLWVKNGSGGNVTVTVKVYGTLSASGVTFSLADVTKVLANGEEAIWGPFEVVPFNRGDGYVYYGFNSAAGVTHAVLNG